MAPLAEFTLFPLLPMELRLMVWERVPQPARVIGQVTCAVCWKNAGQRPADQTGGHGPGHGHDHGGCITRYVINAREEAIFPPLHACRESRAAWLPRYAAPPRYLEFDGRGARFGQTDCVGRVVFDVPLVSYERDIFAIFHTTLCSFEADIDPFAGFDRRRIRHVAVSEYLWTVGQSVAVMDPQGLPSLRTVSVLVFGPDANPPGGAVRTTRGWQEMPASDIAVVSAALLDIPRPLVAEHPFFGNYRLRNARHEPMTWLRRLASHVDNFKGWLWHASRWPRDAPRELQRSEWLDFDAYMRPGAAASMPCPFSGRPELCPGNHTREETLGESDRYEVGVKMLVEEGCLAEMTASSALSLDPTGEYEHFYDFRERWRFTVEETWRVEERLRWQRGIR